MKKSGKVFIITGMSGAGKSQALKCFEDFGFYCVDNIPIALIPGFIRLAGSTKYLGDVAFGIDIREERFNRKGFIKSLGEIKKNGLGYKVLFLDASDAVLVQRFSETRHRHPLGKNISKAIAQERRMLRDIKAVADKEIDTTNLVLGELKEILSTTLELKRSKEMNLTIVSFGYKYGLPLDADLVMDMRFMPNPNYIPELKHKTGLDGQVQKYIKKNSVSMQFLQKYTDLISFLIPLYISEGKSYLTVAIGCTGGRHRSVFVAHYLAGILAGGGFRVSEFHRDVRK